jgi:hypothetical protein
MHYRKIEEELVNLKEDKDSARKCIKVSFINVNEYVLSSTINRYYGS